MFEFLAGLPGPLATALYFVLSLFPLVLIHELGHFAVAKLNRVGVDEFGLGFPPRLARIASFGGTDYTVNVLPLGGFVRLAGEDDPTAPGAFAAMSKRVRAAVLIAGPLANFAFAAVVFAGIAYAGHLPQIVAGIDGVRVARVTAGSPAESAGLLPGDMIVATDGQPLVAADSITKGTARTDEALRALTERADAATGRALELTVVRGVLAQVETEAAPPAAARMLSDVPGVRGVRLTAPDPAYPGLVVGDIVLADPGGEAAATAAESSEDRPVALREASVIALSVVPVRSAPGQPGRMGVQITAPSIPMRYGPLAAVEHGLRMTATVLHAMVTGLAQMVVGQAAVELKGPVGISMMSREFGEQGPVALLEFMALLSLNLGLLNLLPIPALDGGRLLFIAFEALRGRRIEPAREALLHVVGFVLVISLMAVITLVEVARLTGLAGQ